MMREKVKGPFVISFFPNVDAKYPTDAKGSETAKCVNNLIRKRIVRQKFTRVRTIEYKMP